MALGEILSTLQPLQVTVAAATIIAVCFVIFQLNQRARLGNLPVVGEENDKWRQTYLKNSRSIYANGYKKFKDSVYRLVTSDGQVTVVVPPQLLPELKKLGDDVLSFPKSSARILEAKYTKIQTEGPVIDMVLHSVKADLTPALTRLNPVVCEEVDETTREEFGSPADWEEHKVYDKLCRIVAKASGRIIVGPEHCHDQEYIDCAIRYTVDLVGAQMAVKQTTPWLRPLLAPRLPAVKLLREREAKARAFVKNIVEARRKAEKNDPNYQKPDDMLQWYMNRNDENGIGTVDNLTSAVLVIAFAAIHTTTATVTNMVHSLAAFPEYTAELREEIRSVMADNDGIITTRALASMVKLDSFMKECIRFDQIGMTSFTRVTLKGVTLSNGQYIPPGAFVECPSAAIYVDEKIYPNSQQFDGYRSVKAREGQTAAQVSRHLFVTTNEDNLHFGYGRHACPGRFFASNEIKMVLARMILEYDVKNVDGGKGREGRIPNQDMGRDVITHTSKPILIRKAQV